MIAVKECLHILDAGLSDNELCERCATLRQELGARNGVLPASMFADDSKRAKSDRHDVGSGIWPL